VEQKGIDPQPLKNIGYPGRIGLLLPRNVSEITNLFRAR
jgi:hypothetical protein